LRDQSYRTCRDDLRLHRPFGFTEPVEDAAVETALGLPKNCRNNTADPAAKGMDSTACCALQTKFYNLDDGLHRHQRRFCASPAAARRLTHHWPRRRRCRGSNQRFYSGPEVSFCFSTLGSCSAAASFSSSSITSLTASGSRFCACSNSLSPLGSSFLTYASSAASALSRALS
jgi:hypothetical protein